MSVRVTCPGCGGAVIFAVGTGAVAVCPYCRSVVARGDRSVENLGKVADLVDTGTVLRLGLTGRYEGVPFQLVGRTQLQHAAGGVWDEWYAALDDGRWGWLAEGQGRFYWTFEAPGVGRDLPEYRRLHPGQVLVLDGRRFSVAEHGVATIAGAEGEIPYRLEPGRKYVYADLSGFNGGFATLDYSSEPPTVYLGEERSLDELAIPAETRREVHEIREIGGVKVDCPQCGGALSLHAPDQTERVYCPYCGAALDCSAGKLAVFQRLKKPRFPIYLPLGSVGEFPDGKRTVIGVIHRSVKFDRKYYWQEYLLYDPRAGFEWLVCSDHHWSRVRPIPSGKPVRVRGTWAEFDGRYFRKFQEATAKVEGVVGECYWKVQVGETAETMDFVRPPEMLSRELSTYGSTREINDSLGIYLTPSEVQAAFHLEQPLPEPEGVAPNQPFRYAGIYKYAVAMIFLTLILGILTNIALPSRLVYQQSFVLSADRPTPPPPVIGVGIPRTSSSTPATSSRTDVFYTDHFELNAHQNLCITISEPSLTGWLVIEADLVRQESGEVQPFLVPMSFYSGVEDGQAWQEGSRREWVFLPAPEPGKYSLRLEVERENRSQSAPLTVEIRQGVPHFRNWFLAFLAVSLIPAIIGIYNLIFSYLRWQHSDYSPFGSSDE